MIQTIKRQAYVQASLTARRRRDRFYWQIFKSYEPAQIHETTVADKIHSDFRKISTGSLVDKPLAKAKYFRKPFTYSNDKDYRQGI